MTDHSAKDDPNNYYQWNKSRWWKLPTGFCQVAGTELFRLNSCLDKCYRSFYEEL